MHKKTIWDIFTTGYTRKTFHGKEPVFQNPKKIKRFQVFEKYSLRIFRNLWICESFSEGNSFIKISVIFHFAFVEKGRVEPFCTFQQNTTIWGNMTNNEISRRYFQTCIPIKRETVMYFPSQVLTFGPAKSQPCPFIVLLQLAKNYNL